MNLLDELIELNYLKTPTIISAFKKIKRQDFVLPGDELKAEINSPLSIGFGQTISQPLTVAFMMEKLNPETGDRILDVGSGSGWTTALLSEIVGETGKVIGLERIKELKLFSEKNLAKYNFIKKGIARVVLGDGWEGLPEEAPFDKIIVSAAAFEIPEALIDQLKINGRLVIPIGFEHETQDIVIITKIDNNKFNEERHHGFIFVPLIKK
jgi:protein-L-isoaspartate(D-aspartate) O-methyltransferase